MGTSHTHFFETNIYRKLFSNYLQAQHCFLHMFACLQGVTRIKYCTDGVLLREMLEDPLLTKYRYVCTI